MNSTGNNSSAGRDRWELNEITGDKLIGLARRSHLLVEHQRLNPKRIRRRRDVVGFKRRVAVIRNAQPETGGMPAGRLLGLPDLGSDCWVDMAGASALTFAEPNTITSWLTRKGPKRNPFPQPERTLGRLYWPMPAVIAWLATERQLDEPDPASYTESDDQGGDQGTAR